MLRIRKKQIEVLSQYMVKQFEDRMINHLRSNFPEQTKYKNELSLRNMIHNGIKKASQYGVRFESDVQTFLEFVTIYGINFDVNPELNWIRKVLQDKSLNPAEKMDTLDRLLHDRGE